MMNNRKNKGLVDIHHHIPDVYREGLAELGITHSGGKSIDHWNVEFSLELKTVTLVQQIDFP